MNAFRRALPPVLLAATALAFVAALERSQACPMQAPPQPLRILYKASERVVVARVGAREVLKKEEHIASVRFALHVSEVVKGPTDRQVLYLHLAEYVGEGAEKDADGKDADGAFIISYSGRPAPRLKRGERYLFFLEPRKGGDYEVNDGGYGIKQLSDEELKIYLERIRELADITRQEPEDRHALLEWIVRCAEHPVTRWEGAYELVVSDAAARAREQQAAEAVQEKGEAAATQEPAAEVALEASAETEVEAEAQAEAQDEAEAQSPDAPDASATNEEVPINSASFQRYNYAPPDPDLAPLLNAVQKQRLADALFTSTEPNEADDLLMRIVKDFGDPRFPPYALARLHRFEEEPPFEAEFWLTALADSLKNKQLTELAQAYARDTTYYEEEEEEKPEAEAQAEAAAADESEEEEEASDEPEETPAEREAREARVKAGAERAARKRSAMLKGILARIDLFVATGQLAAN